MRQSKISNGLKRHLLWMLPVFLLLAGTGVILMVSCTAQSIPTAPPTPTHTPGLPTSTPTVTQTPTSTWTPGGPTATFTLSPTITNTPSAGQLPVGSVLFTGILTNGNAQQSFIVNQSISAATNIYLTNMAWDKTLTGLTAQDGSSGNFVSTYADTVNSGSASFTAETIIEYSTSSYAAYSQVFSFGNTGETGAAGQPGNGTFSGAVTYLKDSGNATGDKIIAFQAAGVNTSTYAVTGPVTFLGAVIFGPDPWQSSGAVSEYYDSYLPPGLSASNSTNLNTLYLDIVSGSGATPNTNVDAILDCTGGSSTAYSGNSSNSNWLGCVEGKSKFGLPGEATAACSVGSDLGWSFTGSFATYQ